MITRSESVDGNTDTLAIYIRTFEEAGWAVRQVVAATYYTNTWLVVFERET
jgi:hypothetical protein